MQAHGERVWLARRGLLLFGNRPRPPLLSAEAALQTTENIIDTVLFVARERFRVRREPEKVAVDRGVRLANRGDVIAKWAVSGVRRSFAAAGEPRIRWLAAKCLRPRGVDAVVRIVLVRDDAPVQFFAVVIVLPRPLNHSNNHVHAGAWIRGGDGRRQVGLVIIAALGLRGEASNIVIRKRDGARRLRGARLVDGVPTDETGTAIDERRMDLQAIVRRIFAKSIDQVVRGKNNRSAQRSGDCDAAVRGG